MVKFNSPRKPLVEIGKVTDKKMNALVWKASQAVLVRTAQDGKIFAPSFMKMYRAYRILKSH